MPPRRSSKAPYQIAKWTAGVVSIATAASTIYALFNKDGALAVLSIIGMVFALILARLVAKAIQAMDKPNAVFYDWVVKILVGFAVLCFMAVCLAIFWPVIERLKKTINPTEPYSTTRTTAEQQMVDIKRKILELNDAATKTPGQAEALGDQMAETWNKQMNLGHQLQKYEYAALAYLIAAEAASNSTERNRLASRAEAMAKEFFSRYGDPERGVVEGVRAGVNKYYKELQDELRENGDLPRTQFIRAVAVAIIGELDQSKKEEARTLYTTLQPDFKESMEKEALQNPWLGPIISK